ncbi:mast cell protease 3-like [Gadus macrocephalus]|uniref:mast cell protease 3-like n=1 Tax=Gadus macrocephalus TaxID=80720 RepID=UPI0028CB48A8|nr:mast cell protease 3-like [Gadus macrocephalus]
MYRLLKLLFIVLACSALQALGGSIINGREVPENSLPYMAYVEDKIEGYYCGGFLIKKDIVLTAAHCDFKPTTIQPIRLPNKRTERIKDNAACFVAGWGATGRRARGSQLREVDVSTINRKTCEKAWRNKLPANIICAGGYRTKKGFCQGDSGGPLECNKMAVGIASFNNHTCHYPDVPNVYTDIAKFLPWINNPKRKCKND